MRALVVYCHPRADSFSAAVRDTVIAALNRANSEIRVTDLYADTFNPVLSETEFDDYQNAPANTEPVARHVADIRWCDTLIFIYPTWWYGQPALLKGWLDRVLLPGVAFLMPNDTSRTIRPGLSHIKRLGLFTTCGASRWLTFLVGAPGKRTIFRGIGFLCGPPLRKVFAAHYLMDSSSPESRRRHLDRVARKMERLTGRSPTAKEATL